MHHFAVEHIAELHLPQKAVAQLKLRIDRDLHVLLVRDAEVRRDGIQPLRLRLSRIHHDDGADRSFFSPLDHREVASLVVRRLDRDGGNSLDGQAHPGIVGEIHAQAKALAALQNVDGIVFKVVVEEDQRLLDLSLKERQATRVVLLRKQLDLQVPCELLLDEREEGPSLQGGIQFRRQVLGGKLRRKSVGDGEGRKGRTSSRRSIRW